MTAILRYSIPETLFNSRLFATYAIFRKWGLSRVFQETISLNPSTPAHQPQPINDNQESRMHVVIQGAGRGIGYAMAKQAIAAGATKLFLTARQPADTDAFADLAPAENLHWVDMDFLDPATITAAASDILHWMPRIDRLVMVAGVLQDAVVKPEKRPCRSRPGGAASQLSGECHWPDDVCQIPVASAAPVASCGCRQHFGPCWLNRR
jgi:hypothetical protein